MGVKASTYTWGEGSIIQSIANGPGLTPPHHSVIVERPLGSVSWPWRIWFSSAEALSKESWQLGLLPLALWATSIIWPSGNGPQLRGRPHKRPRFLLAGSLHSMTGWKGSKRPIILLKFSTVLLGSPGSTIPVRFPESLLLLIHGVRLFLPWERSTPLLPTSALPFLQQMLLNGVLPSELFAYSSSS